MLACDPAGWEDLSEHPSRGRRTTPRCPPGRRDIPQPAQLFDVRYQKSGTRRRTTPDAGPDSAVADARQSSAMAIPEFFDETCHGLTGCSTGGTRKAVPEVEQLRHTASQVVPEVEQILSTPRRPPRRAVSSRSAALAEGLAAGHAVALTGVAAVVRVGDLRAVGLTAGLPATGLPAARAAAAGRVTARSAAGRVTARSAAARVAAGVRTARARGPAAGAGLPAGASLTGAARAPTAGPLALLALVTGARAARALLPRARAGARSVPAASVGPRSRAAGTGLPIGPRAAAAARARRSGALLVGRHCGRRRLPLATLLLLALLALPLLPPDP